jgi:cytochrome P450
MIVDKTDTVIDRLVASLDEPAQTVDLYPIGRSLVLDVVVRALCGPRLAQRAHEIGDLLERTQDYLEAPAISQLPHPFPMGRRHQARRDRRAFDAVIDDEIARIRRAPDGDEHNVLESLVTTGELTDSEIRDQMATLIAAGYDTTSSTLAWVLLRAAATRGLWDRLATEADAAFDPLGDERDPDHATLAQLGLADRTVREALRLHPPGAFGVRETVTDVTAGGYLIRRHTLIAWSTHLAGRDPNYWPDPLVFDPDRHLDPTQVTNARAAWVPFGGGSRNCIGGALAEIELTLVVARLAQRLHLAPTDRPMLPATRRSRPDGGAPLRVTPR